MPISSTEKLSPYLTTRVNSKDQNIEVVELLTNRERTEKMKNRQQWLLVDLDKYKKRTI